MNSMTGFGMACCQLSLGSMTCVIRTLNHRGLTIKLTLPEPYQSFDALVRRRVRAALSRGQVDITCELQHDARQMAHIDHQQLQYLAELCQQLSAVMPNLAPVAPLSVLSWPGIMVKPMRDVADDGPLLELVIGDVLAQVQAARQQEGIGLAQLCRDRFQQLKNCLSHIKQHATPLAQTLQHRLTARLARLETPVEAQRIAQEVAWLAQKADIHEELDRLTVHCDTIDTLWAADKVIGRKLDFLLQECMREVSTIGAKSVTATLSQAVVDMKHLIEQLREQSQNIE